MYDNVELRMKVIDSLGPVTRPIWGKHHRRWNGFPLFPQGNQHSLPPLPAFCVLIVAVFSGIVHYRHILQCILVLGMVAIFTTKGSGGVLISEIDHLYVYHTVGSVMGRMDKRCPP